MSNWTLNEKPTEGGAAQAQRWRGTGWRQVAESPVADTDSGFMAGGRKVVGGFSLSARYRYALHFCTWLDRRRWK